MLLRVDMRPGLIYIYIYICITKKRIKTRRLTNIYHSDDDDVGDGYNPLSTPPLSLSVPLPLSKTGVSSHIVLIFLSTVFWLAFAIGYSQMRDFSNITVIIRVLCLAWITRVQHYSRFYGMFNGSDSGNLISFLLRCSTRPYERGTHTDLNSLV